jgi:AmiR/NasT family two-component response regulator
MGFRILIADDEPLIRVDLRELLEGLGHEVIAEARNGKEALTLIETKKPDVVILDIKMPELDGIELAARISHLYPVIILSAYTESHLIERARGAGVMAYISKPFREGDVSPAVQLAVSHFLERSALAERVSRLKEQLDARKVIERAKGLLMSKEGLSEANSYRRLQKISMDKNKTMKDVAEAVILMLE